MPRVRVGDRVRLNDDGLIALFGSTLGLAHMKTLEMRITRIEPESLTYPEETYAVEVDNKEINRFMISDYCFDPIREEEK